MQNLLIFESGDKVRACFTGQTRVSVFSMRGEMQNLTELWKEVLLIIGEKVGQSALDLWFKPIAIAHVRDRQVTLEIPNRFYREWIEDNFPSIIPLAFTQILGYSEPVVVTFKLIEKQSVPVRVQERKLERRKANLESRGIFLNPKYTFDSFVVAPSNEFVYAAARRICEEPGAAYNPLFVYSGVGLGKTHLMNAVGNEIMDRHPAKNVYYIPTERFVNEVVSMIRHKKQEEFKEKYRNADVLLIDDVQFISGKPAVEEELFHTFNALYQNQKQIVMSSDRKPAEISDVTDRLRSRFGMGLLVDIQPPEFETKVAIIQTKAAMDHLSVPHEVAHFIAGRVKTNDGVRSLEACLITLGAHSSLRGVPITMEMAQEVLKDILIDDKKPITVDAIQKAVCDYFSIKMQDIKARKRTKEIAYARQLAMYLAKKMTRLSLSEIGESFGGKNHATIIYASRQIEEKKEQDPSLARLIENLEKKISSE